MQNLLSPLEQPLPDTLRKDLEALARRDNNSYLQWVQHPEADSGVTPWFEVRLTGEEDGHYALRLTFWIPGWMDERGVSAILPASRSLADCRRGEWAAVELGSRRFPELSASLPRVARTCARLINELWGPTGSDGIQLEEMAYQEDLAPQPFPELGSR